MKNFKAIITTDNTKKVTGRNQELLLIKLPFELAIEIDKNNQIHDVQPRKFADVDIFSKYHGRTADWYRELIEEMCDLYDKNNGQKI